MLSRRESGGRLQDKPATGDAIEYIYLLLKGITHKFLTDFKNGIDSQFQ